LRLHVAISGIAANQLGDLGTAKEHLQHVLDADPNNVDALGVLGSLYLNDGEWDKAMEINDRQISLSTDPATLARLHLSRGRIFAERFDNLDEAEICYREAVTHDIHSKEARAALKELLRARAKWDDLLSLQSMEAEQLQDAPARVQLYLEMAELARERLQDPTRAVVCLELAYRASQGEIEVAERLLQAYIDAAQMDKAEPILEGIIKTLTEQKKVKQLFKFHHLRGQIAEGRGSEDAALASYQAAYDIDATYIPNLLSLGKLQIKRKNWDEGLKVFQALLLHQMKIKSDEDKRDVYFYLGLIREAQGDPRRAKDMFNRALTVDKNHAPSREALGRIG
jgi:tetratricopeptide (TPR) repeat protein